MAIISAGQLRHRLGIQTKTQGPDGEGGYVSTWRTAKTVQAKIEPISARENREYHKVEMEISHRITLRAPVAIESHNRLRFKTRIFEIVRGPRNIDERGKMVEIEALEIEGDSR